MRILSPVRVDVGGLARYIVSYPAGARIYGEGEIGTEMFTIRSGEVEITRTVNGETRTLSRLRKGDFFGETSLLEDAPREATARARSDVEVIRVNGAVFEEMLRRNPEIGMRIMRRLSRQAREAERFADGFPGRRTPEEPGQAAAIRQAEAAPRAGIPELVSVDRRTRFPLNREGDTVLGRADPVTGMRPDVDLTPFDSHRSVSRRHARLYRIGETTYVMEEIGVVSGTFVNDMKLTTGAPVAIQHGDEVKLGLVTFTFWNPVA